MVIVRIVPRFNSGEGWRPSSASLTTAKVVTARIVLASIVVKVEAIAATTVVAIVRDSIMTVRAVTVLVHVPAIMTRMLNIAQRNKSEYKEQFVDPNGPIRLNKFLANAGVCSRREADEFITAGVVSVNGEVVTELGTKIKRSRCQKFHDEPVSIERKVYVLLNKPKDTVTTSDDPQERRTVMDLVKGACNERIYPVGRLDRNTTGVLLLTNDGDSGFPSRHIRKF